MTGPRSSITGYYSRTLLKTAPSEQTSNSRSTVRSAVALSPTRAAAVTTTWRFASPRLFALGVVDGTRLYVRSGHPSGDDEPSPATLRASFSESVVKVDVGGEVVRAPGSDGSISMPRMESPIYSCAVRMTLGANDRMLFLSSFRLDLDKKGGLLLHP